MELDKLNLNHLNYFLTVLKTGSFSETALEHQIAQSTVSHAIQELENILGHKLFNRGRQGAKPTALALRLAVPVRKMLNQLDYIAQEVDLLNSKLSGKIRIATLRSVATFLLPQIIKDIQQVFPEIEFEILPLNSDEQLITNMVEEGTVDIGISHLINPKLLTYELCRDEYVAIAPKGKLKTPPTWEDIRSHPFINSEAGCSLHLTKGKDLYFRYNIAEDSVLISMVQHNLGISIMPLLAVHPIPANLDLFPLPEYSERIIYSHILPENENTPLIRKFLEVLGTIQIDPTFLKLPPEYIPLHL